MIFSDNKSGVDLIDIALSEPGRESAGDAMSRKIDDKVFALKRAMDRGCTPDEFHRLETVRNALEVGHYSIKHIRAALARRETQ